MPKEKKPKRKIFSPLEGLAKEAKFDPYAFLAPELREAKMLEESDPNKAFEIREAYFVKFRKERAEEEADQKAKKNRTGKYDPVNFPLGMCRNTACFGDIVAKDKWVSSGEMRIGGPSNSFRTHDCYYCKSCGAMYAFIPEKR